MENHLIKLAFEFASDLSKQLITLSTGIIVITITFTKDILIMFPQSRWKILGGAWTIYFISVIFGILHLMALTGALEQAKTEIPQSAHLYNGIQFITFMIATALVIYYGLIGLRVGSGKVPENKERPPSIFELNRSYNFSLSVPEA